MLFLFVSANSWIVLIDGYEPCTSVGSECSDLNKKKNVTGLSLKNFKDQQNRKVSKVTEYTKQRHMECVGIYRVERALKEQGRASFWEKEEKATCNRYLFSWMFGRNRSRTDTRHRPSGLSIIQKAKEQTACAVTHSVLLGHRNGGTGDDKTVSAARTQTTKSLVFQYEWISLYQTLWVPGTQKSVQNTHAPSDFINSPPWPDSPSRHMHICYGYLESYVRDF